MPSPARARLALIASAVLFSTGGAAIKLTTLPATQVAGLRALIAAVVLLVVLRVRWRSFGAGAWAIGVAQAVTMLTTRIRVIGVCVPAPGSAPCRG